jgi:DNA-binding transcriptional MerR regulator
MVATLCLFYFIFIQVYYIMVLTREEKERLVLDLYNRRTFIRDIAREAGMSFRDIGRIIDKKEKEKEAMEGQVQQITQSTQTYKLFSEGSTPEEVAIALNLRQSQVTELYTEHWRLKGLYMLGQIYGQIKDDIGSFVNLYRSAKAAGMSVQNVIRLLAIANNHLPSVEYTYEICKREVEDLEAEKGNSARIYQEINDKILSMRKG